MTKLYYLLGVLFGMFLLAGCFDEEDIHVDLEHGSRVYDSTSSDPVQKYLAEFYFDYGKEIILDPEVADYVYNFQNKNDVELVALNKEEWAQALDMVRELFLDSYSVKTKKDFFPVNLIIVDSIKDFSGLSPVMRDMFSSRNFAAFVMDEKKCEMTEEEKEDYSLQMHMAYLSEFCVNNERLLLKEAFYNVSAALYGLQDAFPTIEEAYEVGFVQVVQGGWWYPCPSKLEDVEQWIEFLLTTPQEEINEIVEKYDAMRIKYQELLTALKEMGIDYANLVYKSNK